MLNEDTARTPTKRDLGKRREKRQVSYKSCLA